MARDQRADFEQRLLALIRKELDDLDEDQDEQGYAIGRFAVLYEVLHPPGDDADIPPWAHGWERFSSIEYAFTDSSWWAQLGMVREILDQLEDERSDQRWDRRHPKSDTDAGESEEDESEA